MDAPSVAAVLGRAPRSWRPAVHRRWVGARRAPGRQTREHADLDLWLTAPELEPLIVAFAPIPFPGPRGRGAIAGVAVRCCGYPPRSVDRLDVPLLCERFGIALPEAFQ